MQGQLRISGLSEREQFETALHNQVQKGIY